MYSKVFEKVCLNENMRQVLETFNSQKLRKIHPREFKKYIYIIPLLNNR